MPADPAMLADNCYEAYNIQVQGLAQRLKATGLEKLVIGVSGGLDSTQALIVSARVMERLGLPRGNILAYTLPGFATGNETKANAWRLMKALGVTGGEIDIRPAANQMFGDIGHPSAKGEPVYDVTFENVQAGLRTDYLFRLANHNGALVVGTGDLSELALGWCTYGVGDHMSHYNPNASVAKTLVQHLIRFVAASGEVSTETAAVLADILATEISPELVPAGADGAIQSTESIVGPYALQDFNLFYATRYGFLPSKIAYLAWHAWHDAGAGGGRPTPRPMPGAPTTSARSRAGCGSSSNASSSRASSSARPCRTAPRSPRAAPCRRAAIGAPPRIRMPRSGSPSWKRAFPTKSDRRRDAIGLWIWGEAALWWLPTAAVAALGLGALAAQPRRPARKYWIAALLLGGALAIGASAWQQKTSRAALGQENRAAARIGGASRRTRPAPGGRAGHHPGSDLRHICRGDRLAEQQDRGAGKPDPRLAGKIPDPDDRPGHISENG